MDYTQHLNTILTYARQEAERLLSDQILPDHLLLAILRVGEGKAYELLTLAGVDPAQLKRQLDDRLRTQTGAPVNVSSLALSRASVRILRLAAIEAQAYSASAMGSVHLLLAILRENHNYPSKLLQTDYQVTYLSIEKLYPHPQTTPTDSAADYDVEDNNDENASGDLFAQILGGFNRRASGEKKNKKNTSQTPCLDTYSRDLTRLAREGKLDCVIGRENEIKRLLLILARRKKNNPILIGEPGVGKSAIVEGLAQTMLTDPRYGSYRVISLNMASIVAGTTYRGQFEQRMKELITELRNHPEIILFIDEIHTLIGAGNAQGSLDAANILKPALARGEVRCIGATTTAEYRTGIEKDGALERRFQKVLVRPATVEQTYRILQGLQASYQGHHHVRYDDDSLRACAELTDRYISDRALPDKAIDAMDEAGAMRHGGSVTRADIDKVVSAMSGVPVQRVSRSENSKLLHMDEALRRHVIGQDEAIDKIVRAIRRARLGLRDPNRPIGTFFFLGSTGVGKTFLAQTLAEEMFGSRDALIRFDMSEYMEKHTVSLLVGAPPGYIAHEDGGKLTEAVRRKPYSIILFDEIEKAHPDIFNVLLQVLDEGRMTDRQGQSVDFKNTIIILTSNVGTRQLRDFGAGIGFDKGEVTSEMANQMLTKALNKTFPPEFVNRIDDIITFAPLSYTTLARILDIEVHKLQQRLKRQGYRLILTADAKKQLLDKAYDPKNGARPVKRAVQTWLEDNVTESILLHPDNKTIRITKL